MKILVFPYDDNPYQTNLYAALGDYGYTATYLGRTTASHTLNIALLPWELLCRRVQGAKILHLHWTTGFALAGSQRFPFMRRVSRLWFELVLRFAHAVRIRIIWTAHNVLPHSTVFDDDVRARHLIASLANSVIVHGASAQAQLQALGLQARQIVVVPHGPYRLPPPSYSAISGVDDHVYQGRKKRLLAFIGRIEPYKNVDRLLTAVSNLPDEAAIRLLVAGVCADPSLRRRLTIANAATEKTTLELGYVSEQRLSDILRYADALVLPATTMTTSGTAVLALGAGLPLILPDGVLPDLPVGACIRYDGSEQALRRVLLEFSQMPPNVLDEHRTVARSTQIPSWNTAAALTANIYRESTTHPGRRAGIWHRLIGRTLKLGKAATGGCRNSRIVTHLDKGCAEARKTRQG